MTKEQILKGLVCHSKLNTESENMCDSCCNTCPYSKYVNCTVKLTVDALSLMVAKDEKPDFIRVDELIIDLNSIKTVQLVTDGNLIVIDTHTRHYPYSIKADSRTKACVIFEQIYKQILSRSIDK